MDSSTKPVSQMKSAGDLQKRFSDLRQDRTSRERQWKLNLSFYRGNHYAFYNRVNRRIEQLPIDDADKPRHRVRITANRITRGVQGYTSKLTKTKPILTATPETGDENALKAAQVSENLLDMWWADLHLRQKQHEALTWAAVTGQGYWKITWDPFANKAVEFILDPEGNPVTDNTKKTIYQGHLQQAGVDLKDVTKTVYLGDVSVEAMSPFDVYLDTAARTFSECRFAICRHALPCDEIKAKYKVDVTPDAMMGSPDESFSFFPMELNKKKDLKYVYYGYFKPTAALPKGRYVIWVTSIDDNNKGAESATILHDEAWPYPFQCLPLVKFPGIIVPGEVYDRSIVEDAIPLQKEYNRALSQIIEHKNLTVKPQWISPIGSLREKLTTEPGAVYQYNPVQGLGPQPMPIPGIPSYVFDHVALIKTRLDEMFYETEITQGNVPPNVEAGIAIELLQEMAADKIEPIIGLMEVALADAGQMMLSLAQKYYVEQRILKISGSGSSTRVRQFTNADIAGGITVRCEAGSGLPKSRAGRQAQIMEWVREGIIPKDRAWKYFEVADMKALGQQFMADADMAAREHDRMIQGQPVNFILFDQAKEKMMQMPGINPDTQQPWQGPEEQQDWLDHQALQPTNHEDYREHLDIHSQFMKSLEYEGLDPETQEKFDTHYTLTMQRLISMPRQPDKIESPKVSLRLQGTVGPHGAASILNRAGVPDVTGEVMSEPPLETVVFDNLDKQNPGEQSNNAGNDPFAMAAYEQWKQQQQQQMQQQQMLQQEEAHHQKLVHTEQLHQQKLGQMADAAAATKKPSR